MKSNWELTKSNSNYHFDSRRVDSPQQVVQFLGHITPTWSADLENIVTDAKPATWASRGYKTEHSAVPSAELEKEEYDLVASGMGRDLPITHFNWQIPASLQRISDSFALADCMNRIHVQRPGEMWNLHIDKLFKWFPDNPERVMRISIQLTDWQPGQFWEYGNYHHNQWLAGEVTAFDWQNLPHCTANAGYHPRVTFQITGIKTPATDKFLNTLKYKTTQTHLTNK
jgi:hypothetical protein